MRSIAAQQHHFRYNKRNTVASLVAAASISAAIVSTSSSDTDSQSEKTREQALHRTAISPARLCTCEEASLVTPHPPQATANSTATPKPLSRVTRVMYASWLYPYSYLPVPRVLTPRDPLFSYPELERGLIRRHKDEEKVERILSSNEVMEARQNRDHAQIMIISQQMNSVVYGKGVSPQIREDFLMQYGCTGFTDNILQYLVQNYGSRGIVEVGAGNGQWARALSDHFKQQTRNSAASKPWEFIVAFDNMAQLPLSPKIYHKNTVPAHEYFYNKVQKSSHIDAVQGSRGRVLLMVYPPPGKMALETVQAYIQSSPGYSGSCQNDTLVYVGEGRGGANADDAFFDYILGCNQETKDGETSQWVIERVMGVRSSPGGKGYEKMFVFRRKSSL